MPALLAAEAQTPTPFYASDGGYDQCWTNISGNIVNFYNTNDFALVSGSYVYGLVKANWEINQETQKPEWFFSGLYYTFYQPGSIFRHTGDDVQFVFDFQEARSMVARSHSAAIGAQGPVTGQTRQGIISGSVDLISQFGFDKTRPEHSAQFTRPIQTMKPYYDTIVRIFNAPTP